MKQFLVSPHIIMVGAIVLVSVGGIKAWQLSTRILETSQQQVESTKSEASIQVIVKRQEQSPLLIQKSNINAADSFRPQVDFLIENRSSSPISAYAVAYEVSYGDSTAAGVTLTDVGNPENILEPSQSRSETVSGLPATAKRVERITLIVDFVEFADGSSWGRDTHQSAERLSGHRAGKRAASQYYLELLELRGSSSVIQAYESERETILPPQGHSQKWEDGFRSGTNTVRARLQHAVKIGTSEEIKSELQRIASLAERR